MELANIENLKKIPFGHSETKYTTIDNPKWHQIKLRLTMTDKNL